MKASLLSLDGYFIGCVEKAVLPLAESFDVSRERLEQALDFGFPLFLVLGVFQTSESAGKKFITLAILAVCAATIYRRPIVTSTSSGRTWMRSSMVYASLRLTAVVLLTCSLVDTVVHLHLSRIFTLLAVFCFVLELYVKASYGGGLRRKRPLHRITSEA